MTSRVAFTVFVLVMAIQRLLEVQYSSSNTRRLVARGGREHAAWQVPLFKLLHGAWIASACAEVWLLDPPFRPWLAVVAAVVFFVGQVLRFVAITTLGSRWTIRIVTVPDAPPVTAGIYRYIRHPNYAGVALEIAALPLIHGAIYTAVVFSLANAWLLSARIRAEETALATDNHYLDHFGQRPRFVPPVPRDRRSP